MKSVLISAPMTDMRNVKTPTLLQGESDATDPIGPIQQFYRGLKRRLGDPGPSTGRRAQR